MRRVSEVMKGGRSAGVSRWVWGGVIFVDDVARLRLGVWRVVASEGWRWTEVGPGLGARGWRASTREHFSAARCGARVIAAVRLCPPVACLAPRPAPPARGLAHNVCVWMATHQLRSRSGLVVRCLCAHHPSIARVPISSCSAAEQTTPEFPHNHRIGEGEGTEQ